MKFVISGRLDGLNEMINQARANRFGAASKKKKETMRCAWAVIGHGIEPITRPIHLTITWIEPDARRDIDNVAAGAKFILDGLVESGKLPNDGRKWVCGLTHIFPEPDAKNPRVEVEITQI